MKLNELFEEINGIELFKVYSFLTLEQLNDFRRKLGYNDLSNRFRAPDYGPILVMLIRYDSDEPFWHNVVALYAKTESTGPAGPNGIRVNSPHMDHPAADGGSVLHFSNTEDGYTDAHKDFKDQAERAKQIEI